MATPSQSNVALLTQDPAANTNSAVLNLAGGGSTSQRPSNPPQWFHYYDLDLGRDVIWDGTQWVVTVAGPQGFQGAQGPLGAQGFQGFQGVQGAQGAQGQATPMNSGPTSSRPSNPGNFERYFDTDINCQIWWERGAWRTVEGVPGDVKFVLSGSTGDATTRNPGWSLLPDTMYGRSPMFAGQGPGLTNRNPGEAPGEEGHQLVSGEMKKHRHVWGRAAVNTNDDFGFLIKTDGGPLNYGVGTAQMINGELNGYQIRDIGSLSGNYLVTNSAEDSGADSDAHNTVHPVYVMIGLKKD